MLEEIIGVVRILSVFRGVRLGKAEEQGSLRRQNPQRRCTALFFTNQDNKKWGYKEGGCKQKQDVNNPKLWPQSNSIHLATVMSGITFNNFLT